MWFNCNSNHNQKELAVGEDLFKYCIKCRKVWYLADCVYTTRSTGDFDFDLERGKTWKEVKDLQKKKDFWNFLQNNGIE